LKNEEEHIDVREKLLKLPRVKARDGFENELLRRINLLDAQTVKPKAGKSSIWDSIFGRKSLMWTVPAMSLVVIAIVFVGVYFAFFKSKDMQNTSVNKQSATEQSRIESLKTFTDNTENKRNDIPGKEIANDLEISRSPKTETKSLEKGLNETYIDQYPKPIVPTKTNVIDSRKETTTYEKADDVGKSGKTVKQADEKEVGNMNNGVLKEEKKVEESSRSFDPDKKKLSPMIKDVEKVKPEKGNSDVNDKIESKVKGETKITDDTKVKEDAKKKEDTRKKEEKRKKEEARKKEESKVKEETKKKEDLEKLKEKIKEN
jgi:hypothetical protein